MNKFVMSLEDADADLTNALSSFTIDASSCGIVVASATLEDFPIVYVNAAFLAMTGVCTRGRAGP